MLIEFSIENYRSIKEKVTLSLVSSSDKSLDNNLIKTTVLKNDNLCSAAIYGANASGKTNVLLAFNFLKELVMTSHKNQKGDKIEVSPFKLDKNCVSKPSRFEVVFIKNNIKYIYGVSVTSEKVVDEYLYYYPKGREATIFKRSDTYSFTIDKNKQTFLSERILDNVLYLSGATQLNYDKTSDAFDWFKDTLQVIGPTDNPGLQDFTIGMLNKDESTKALILKALSEADLGIDDIAASIKNLLIDELPSDFPEELKPLAVSGKIKKVHITSIHKVMDGKGNEQQVPFEFKDESEGTQRMFSLIGPWINTLINGHVLIVDELDTKLHHKLVVFLVKLFSDPTQNKNNAQLIFTTHNVNLLDQDIFRRDQIWFTEKNPDFGSTDLYSLVEFSPRKDKNIQKGYLAGRYGALPFIKDERIF
ncbi:MAG: AAA family ATPase [Methanosarcinaceae archaeon]